MRFGLPADYELVVDTQLAQLPDSVDRNDNLAPQSLINIIDSIPVRNKVPDKFRDMISSIDRYSRESRSRKLNEVSEKVSAFNNDLHSHTALIQNVISDLTTEFNNKLQLQNSEVQKIIHEEKERIRLLKELEIKKEQERLRKIEEERLRKLEEERIRQEKERLRKEEEERARKLAEEKKKALEEEKQKALELEKKQKEEQAKRVKLAKEEEEKKKLQAATLADASKVENQFLKYKADIASIKKDVVGKLDENKDLKKSVNQIKRKINPKFGQLSNSRRQLQKISQEVIELVKLTQQSPLAYKFILNFIAKAVVDQAETEVIVKPTAALPLAHLSRALLQAYPEFEYFLNARFVKKCPFIIGYSCSIDSEQGRTRMGWKRRDGKWEDEVKYDERVSGICTVWAAMARLDGYAPVQLYSVEASWTFLARSINLKPELITNTQFSVVSNWWEAAAKQFLPKFGKQGVKIMTVLVREWPLSVANRKYPAAARLLIFGEDWMVNNKIDALKEMEP
ncbi:GLE1-like protein-domain-containing protein [Scheffersomyces coipomensis]|uniref:GLE1-like protein-domain-containing protein n=1 Tax=Scheffersomyces coipomensis TaxID=1788519 RepID=UPI00315DCCA2